MRKTSSQGFCEGNGTNGPRSKPSMFWPRVLRGWLRGRGRTITSVNTFQTTPRSGPKCRFGSRVCAGRDLRRRTPPDATARAAPASRCKTRRLAAPELPRCVRLQNQYRRVRVLDERDRRALRIDRRILVDASAGDDRFEATCLRFGANVIQTNRRRERLGWPYHGWPTVWSLLRVLLTSCIRLH